jgi:hypothetical protein
LRGQDQHEGQQRIEPRGEPQGEQPGEQLAEQRAEQPGKEKSQQSQLREADQQQAPSPALKEPTPALKEPTPALNKPAMPTCPFRSTEDFVADGTFDPRRRWVALSVEQLLAAEARNPFAGCSSGPPRYANVLDIDFGDAVDRNTKHSPGFGSMALEIMEWHALQWHMGMAYASLRLRSGRTERLPTRLGPRRGPPSSRKSPKPPVSSQTPRPTVRAFSGMVETAPRCPRPCLHFGSLRPR